jgi:hypothetical protein
MTISHRVDSQTLAGLVDGFVGIDLPFATIAGVFELTRLDLRVTDAPSGGTVVAMVNTVAGGGGSDLLQGTIADGDLLGTVTGSVLITGTTTLYLRVVSADDDAMGLSASVEVSASGADVAFILLSTLQRVKDVLQITDSTNDAALLGHLEGVSAGMQSWMQREIPAESRLVERHLTSGLNSEILTNEWPIVSVEEVRNGTTVQATDTYRIESERILRRVSSGVRFDWPENAEIEVDYTSGYASIPPDLVDACAQETARRWLQTVAAGGPGAHVSSLGPSVGDTESVLVDGFLPQTITTMRPYQRFANG